jgi:hypothetical protein
MESFPLRVKWDVRIGGQHLGWDVSRNRHDRPIASLRLGKLFDRVLTQIVEAQPPRTHVAILSSAQIRSDGLAKLQHHQCQIRFACHRD